VTKSVTIPRSAHEKEEIAKSFGDGLIAELIQILGSLPSVSFLFSLPLSPLLLPFLYATLHYINADFTFSTIFLFLKFDV
jgi:hypothetical protein